MKQRWVLLAAAALLAIQGSAQAVSVLNVDFQPTINDPAVSNNTYTVNYTGTAAAPGAGTVWNRLLTTNPSPASFIGQPGYYDEVAGAVSNYTDLLNSTGAATPIDVSFSAGGVFAVENNAPNMVNIATNAQGMMRDYLIAFRNGGLSGARTVTVSGLVPNEPLILYAYGEGDQTSNSRQTTFNANGVIGSTQNDSGANHLLTEGTDYVRLTGITANASGVLTISYAANNVDEGPFNGFQLIYNLSVGVAGDTDGDNDVDMADYNNIKNNFRISGLLTRMQGDIAGPSSETVGDGIVDFYDFIAWQKHFPSPGAGAGAGGLGAVPEPSTLLLALGTVSFLFAGRRRSHR